MSRDSGVSMLDFLKESYQQQIMAESMSILTTFPLNAVDASYDESTKQGLQEIANILQKAKILNERNATNIQYEIGNEMIIGKTVNPAPAVAKTVQVLKGLLSANNTSDVNQELFNTAMDDFTVKAAAEDVVERVKRYSVSSDALVNGNVSTFSSADSRPGSSSAVTPTLDDLTGSQPNI